MKYNIIPEFPAYEISECGTVVRRIINQKEVMQAFQLIKGKSTGYLYCTLTWDENNQYLFPAKRIAVHRLVAYAWLNKPITTKHVWINHIDGNKSNNHFTNIEWTTISQNIQHAWDTGLNKRLEGEDHWRHGKTHNLITRKAMSEAKKGMKHPKFKGYYFVNFKRYESANQAAKAIGSNTKTVINRCNNDKWKLKGWYFLDVSK